MCHVMRLMAVIVIFSFLVGCSKLTVENYSKIKLGTSYNDAVKILGKPDSCSEILTVRNCIWGDEKKNIALNFVGDKVVFYTSTNIK